MTWTQDEPEDDGPYWYYHAGECSFVEKIGDNVFDVIGVVAPVKGDWFYGPLSPPQPFPMTAGDQCHDQPP